MKKRILFFMIAVFLLSAVTYAQDTEKDGTAFQTAIPVVFTQGKATFTDMRNTAAGPPWYYTYLYKHKESDSYMWTQGRAVFYRVQMAASGDLKVHNWYSPNLGFTTLFLVAPLDPAMEPDENFNCDLVREVASFNVGDFCDLESDFPEYMSRGLGYLHVKNLPAGTYYIIAAGYKNSNGSVPNGQLKTTIIADLISEIPGEPGIQPELPNYSPVQYQYDLSGNRTKNIKKTIIMKIIQKLFMVVAGLLPALSTQAQIKVSGSTNDVGEIPIQYALSSSGAVTYQVPMDIHPVPNQFQPQLSFSYSSQQGESSVGYGWNIGGLSAITHTAGNIYYDGSASPLSLSEDKFMLDGVRLIKTGTDAWQTEQGFVKVKKQADGKMEVRYPNGNVATFETSANAPFSYVLTSCTNIQGRSIKYVYSQADNLPYIRKIMYGANDNDSIVFSYRNMTDGIARYADGKLIRNNRLLSNVKSYYRGKIWRNYLLTYEKEEVNQLVQLDCRTENRALNPLRFEYGEKRSIERFQSRDIHLENYFMNAVIGSYESLVLSRGRFKPKSVSDGLISYPRKSTYSVIDTRNLGGELSYKFGSTYTTTQQLAIYKNLLGFIIDTPPATLKTGYGFQQLAAVDVSGTGVDALVKINLNMNVSDEELTVKVYNNIDKLNSYKEYAYKKFTRVHDGAFASPRQREFLFGDFNGDGKVELLAIATCRDHNYRDEKRSSHAWLINLQTGEVLLDDNVFDYAYFQQNPNDILPDRLLTMDYNGDGKTDVCLINHDGTYVYEYTGNGFKKIAYTAALNLYMLNDADRELMVADVNGDGTMDLIFSPPTSILGERPKHLGTCCNACKSQRNYVATSAAGYKIYQDMETGEQCAIDPSIMETVITKDNGKNWEFILSTGNSEYSDSSSGFTIQANTLVHTFHETSGLSFMMVDVDSDGLPDLLRKTQGKIELYLNKNGKINSAPEQRATMTLSNPNAQFVVANVAQLNYWVGGLICVDNQNIYSYDYTRKEGKERMLHALTNSYGIRNEHNYLDIMTANDTRYEINNELGNFKYPYVMMTPHCYVAAWAKQMKNNVMGEWLSWTNYKYTNAVFHCTGLGFRGFQQIESTDFHNPKLKTISTFDPALMGAEVKSETPTDTIIRDYILQINPDKTLMLKLQKESKLDALNRTETKVEYEYNIYGQRIHSTITKGTSHTERQDMEYQNIDNKDKYLLGIPTLNTSMTISNDSTCNKKTRVEYDVNSMPVHKLEYYNGNTISEEYFTYDENQRLIKHKQRPYESKEWLARTYSYDSMGHLLRETDSIGSYVDYQYDETNGLLKSATDHKGRITRNEYDEWGKQLAIYRPDGSKKQTVTAWCNEGDPGLFTITNYETGKPTVKVFCDQLGREVRKSQFRFDGKEMKIDSKYNEKTGLLEQTSQPTTAASPSRWDKYVYDEYYRRTSTRYASGKIDSCAYGALTDTIVENGIRHIRKYNEMGQLTLATDAAGSIQYYYRPDGNLFAVVAPEGVQTRFYYDKYGRQIAIKDPSAGIRHTEYDVAGNVCKETDADGRDIVKEYDRYGRVTKQKTTELETTYTYDNTENVMLSAVSNNGTAIYCTYDSCGRMKTRREEAPDNVWLQKKYEYNTDGILSSVSYTTPTGALTTEKRIFTNGYLTEVRLSDGTLIYRHNEENALGQLTKLFAGGMNRSYTFNEWGLPTKRTITRANGTVVFNSSYNFNVENNNLETRKDEVRGFSEAFTYDNLNRLSTYGGLKVIYDNNGNILSKNDAGTLAYTNPNRPYAVTGLEPISGKQIPTGLDIIYTAAQRPSLITQGTKRAVLTYNANHDRVRMQLSDANTASLTRYYMGNNYEYDIDATGVSERLYLGGDYYSAPAVLIKQNNQIKIYYIHRDYLGSILQIVDTQGTVIEENNYDAWGNRRNPATYVVYAAGTAPQLMLGRGFTGHEHLDMFGLINMNARLYDPILGRFLSPDPFIQSPDFTQAFNRFSYCMNSPLCFVDKDGEFFWYVVAAAAAIGGIINLSDNWNNVDNFWQGLGYLGVGAVAGAAGVTVGGLVGTVGGVGGGMLMGAASGAVTGFLLSGGNTLMGGGSLEDAWHNAKESMLSSALMGSIMGGFGGGFTSWLEGKNIWTGSTIAPGRNAFSLKNTPIVSLERHTPNAFLPDEMPDIALLDEPLSSVPETLNPINETSMTSYEKGELGVNRAMQEFEAAGGEYIQREITIDVPQISPNGTTRMVRNRFDFGGQLNGKLYLYEIKNGPSAGFTANQKINLPKLIMDHPQFIPRGYNASRIPFLKGFINKPYFDNYVVIIKHTF